MTELPVMIQLPETRWYDFDCYGEASWENVEQLCVEKSQNNNEV
jgi:hypothetical protein